METLAAVVIVGGAILCFVLFSIMYRQTMQDYRERKEQLDQEHRELLERHRRMDEALERYHTYQHHRMLQIGVALYREPEFTPSMGEELEPPSEEDMAMLTDAGILGEQNTSYENILSMSRAWNRMGQTLYDVLDAAPDPFDCATLTGDEFEDIIRRRLEEKRKGTK